MEDTGRQFLEQQVKTADDALDEAVQSFMLQLKTLDGRFSDVVIFRQALEAYTRNSENPYTSTPLSHPLDKLLEERGTTAQKAESEPKRARRGDSLPAPNTKIGVAIRLLIRANGKGMKLDEVYKSQADDAPLKLTKADLYRCLPKLVSEDKAWRDSGGYYYAGPRPADSEITLREGRGEGQDNHLPLAG